MLRLTCALLTFLLTACSSYQEPSNSDLEETSTSVQDFQKSLQGTWERPCAYDSGNGYYKEALAFKGWGSSFELVTQDYFYSDAACTLLTLRRTQTFSIDDMDANGNLYSFSATLTAQTLTPATAQAAAGMTAAHSCGINQWLMGGTLDTTTTSCNSLGTVLDTLALTNGYLFRALDEVANPSLISGTVPQGSPYVKKY